ncbi:hypothetical protein C8Q79DRAFT_971707 [Trametes meyenii]|nr:hypothetical protein C8Q79DRAFT_971707 [Trametes meyenii]
MSICASARGSEARYAPTLPQRPGAAHGSQKPPSNRSAPTARTQSDELDASAPHPRCGLHRRHRRLPANPRAP